MAEQNEGQGQDPNSPEGEQTSQNDYYKVFESEDEYKEAQDKFFRGAYNEGKQKQYKDFVSKAQENFDIEGDFESIDELFDSLKQRMSTQNGSDGEPVENKELEELRSKLKDAQQKIEQKESEFTSFKQQQKIDSAISKAMSDVKSSKNLNIGDKHAKMLFEADYNVKLADDGNAYVERADGTPVLDGEGNRKPVSEVFSSFVSENNLAKPTVEGAGGGTSGAATQNQPKWSEYKKLLSSNKMADREKAMKMRANAQEHGWHPDDSKEMAMSWKK